MPETTLRCCWPDCEQPPYSVLPLCRCHAEQVWQRLEAETAGRKTVAKPKLAPHQRHGYVYYLNVHDRMKIGFAAELDLRLKSYPPGSVLLAAKVGTLADEQAEHQRCTPWRVAGREWYELNESTRRVAAEAAQLQQERDRETDNAWRLEAMKRVSPPLRRPDRKHPLQT